MTAPTTPGPALPAPVVLGVPAARPTRPASPGPDPTSAPTDPTDPTAAPGTDPAALWSTLLAAHPGLAVLAPAPTHSPTQSPVLSTTPSPSTVSGRDTPRVVSTSRPLGGRGDHSPEGGPGAVAPAAPGPDGGIVTVAPILTAMPATAPSAPTSAPPPPVPVQVAQHVRALAADDARFRAGGARLEVALTPVGLGHVGIRTRVGHDGVLRVDIRCENAATAASLTSALDDLRHHLGDVGDAVVAVRHAPDPSTATPTTAPMPPTTTDTGGGHAQRGGGHPPPGGPTRDPAPDPVARAPLVVVPPIRVAPARTTTLDVVA